jgi:hypothetical protein
MSYIARVGRLTTICLLTVCPTRAAPVNFKCMTSDGVPVADLIVDTENRTFSWGANRYAIHSMNDRYISAYQQTYTGEVGGEVWVLDRITGEYLTPIGE